MKPRSAAATLKMMQHSRWALEFATTPWRNAFDITNRSVLDRIPVLLQRFLISKFTTTLYTSQICCPVDSMYLIPQMLVKSILIHKIPIAVATMKLSDVSRRILMLVERFAVYEDFVAFVAVKVAIT